jgi:DivIVA domain-containing protein
MMDDDDASFRLTPLDVRRYEFGTSLRGYDKMRVDQFREQLASELERLTRQNLDLETKARNFHEQLRAFRERDKALNDALVSAQQLRGDIHDQADREAQLVLREARAEAERILEAARHDARRYEEEVAALERLRRAHFAQLRALAERQLAEILAAEQTLPTAADLSALARASDTHDAGSPPRPALPTPAWLRKVDDA